MANNPMIKFLRGTQEAFEALGTYSDGVFYLTKDTNRLYVGNGTATPSLLNQTVQIVEKVDNLPATATENDFYYCTTENILAVYDGTKWVQINQDTQNKSVGLSAAVNNNVATITSTVTDRTAKSGSMTITAGSNVTLSAANGNLTISATNTDTSTTKAGHYTPSDKDNTLGSASGKVIHQIKVDSKNHVTEIVERNENRVSGDSLSAVTTTGVSNSVTVSNAVTDGYSTKTGSMTISGAGATTVSADGGNITISSTNTDTKVTSAANHYAPTEDSAAALSAGASKFVTGLSRDAKGHVTGVTGTGSLEDVTVGVASTTGGATVTTSAKNVFGTADSDAFSITAGDDITVTADASGKKVTIASTDSKVTSAANHYAPAADTNSKLSVTNKIITGVNRDAKGHVVSLDSQASLGDVDVSVSGTTNSASVTTAVKDVLGNNKSDLFTIVGDGATTVTADATNTKITITSTNTDTKVTSAANHYTPAEDSGSAIDVSNKLITSVKRDTKGHVVDVGTTTTSEDFSMAAAAISGGGATVTGTAKTIFGTNKSGSFNIKGSDATSVSVTNGEVVISSTDTKVTAVGNHYVPSGGTTVSASDGTATAAQATTQVITGITKDAAGHVTGITSVGIKDTHNALSSVDLTVDSSNKLNLSVATTDQTKSDSIALDIKYGKNTSGTQYHTTANVTQNGNANAGKWNLDVYTTSEVDAKISAAVGANGAVQIVGTVDATASPAKNLPTSNIKTGDTYIVTGKGTYNGQAATSGDMFIASADHATGTVASTFWYYIPAGNEAVKLTGATNGFKLQEGNSSTVMGQVEFAAYNASSDEFQVVANVSNATTSGYNKTSVSFDMYWGSF